VITKSDMMDVLVAASPGFAAEWDAFRREWAEEADDLPLYLVLGDFARHVVDLLERNDPEALTRVFAAIELLHVNGDHYAPPPPGLGNRRRVVSLSRREKEDGSRGFEPACRVPRQ